MEVIIKGPAFLGDCVKSKEDDITMYISNTYGFYSDEKFVINSDFVMNKVFPLMPKIAVDLSIIDEERGLVWIPMIANTQGGALYIDKDEKENPIWCVSPYKTISEEEKHNYPIPGTTDQFYDTYLSVEDVEIFPLNEYNSAVNLLKQYNNL